MNRWTTIYDGGSAEWLEMRRFGNTGRVFHAVRITDMDDACGRDNEGHPRYAGELLEIDLDTALVADAARSCGWKLEGNRLINEYDGDIVAEGDSLDAVLAESLVGYGGYAPLASESGNNLRAMMRNLKRESRALDCNTDKREALLSRPVNALGSTAREYALGDFDSAMARGLAQGDANARVMAQMHRPIPQGPLVASVKIQDSTLATLSNGDPLAYMTGFMSGFQGTTDTIEDDEDFAPAYLKGREHGARVRMGLDPAPDWIQ